MSSDYNNYLENVSKWEYNFSRIKNDNSLTEKQRGMILEGYRKLREVFGENFLKHITNERHIISSYFFNMAPWSQLWFANFGTKTYLLKNLENFDSLKERLLNKEKYSGALPEAEIASRLYSNNIKIELIKPTMYKKSPDIESIIGQNKVFFEITSLQTPIEIRKANHTFEELTYPFYNAKVNIKAKIYKALSTPHIKELQQKISDAIKEVENGVVKYKTIEEKGVVDYFVCARDFRGIPQKYINGGIEGPLLNFTLKDEVKRIRRVIEEKSNQIPQGELGVVVIFDGNLFIGLEEQAMYEDLAEEVKETLYEHQNLIGMVFISNASSWTTEDIETENEDFIFIKYNCNDVMQENILIVKNKYSQFDLCKPVFNALKWKS